MKENNANQPFNYADGEANSVYFLVKKRILCGIIDDKGNWVKNQKYTEKELYNFFEAPGEEHYSNEIMFSVFEEGDFKGLKRADGEIIFDAEYTLFYHIPAE